MLRLLIRTILRIVLRHKKITALAILLIIGLVATAFLTQQKNQQPEAPVDTLRLPYEEIEVGYATHEELVGTYGVFDYEYVDGDYVVYAYSSNSSRYAPDRFYLKNDVIELKELYFNPLQRKIRVESLRSLHGEPDAILYTQSSLATSNQVDLYAQKGLAIFSIDDAYVTRIQYFRPTTPEGYKLSWGETLGEAKPTPEETVPHTAE